MAGTLAAAIAAISVTACGPSQRPVPSPPPAGLTEEVRSYARCLDTASDLRFDQTYDANDHIRYTLARCRLLEPPPVRSHAPGSPGNARCSDEYFDWYRSYNQSKRNVISRVFAETVCASPEAAPEKRAGGPQR